MARDPEMQKGIRRTALILAAIAIAFYLGFILLQAVRA